MLIRIGHPFTAIGFTLYWLVSSAQVRDYTFSVTVPYDLGSVCIMHVTSDGHRPL